MYLVGFCVYRRSCLLWSPVLLFTEFCFLFVELVQHRVAKHSFKAK